MQLKIIVAFTLVVLPILSGQPPAGLKRVPPPENVPPLLQQYDFGGQLRTLEESGSLPADVKPELATPRCFQWSSTEGLPAKVRYTADGDSARSRACKRELARGEERSIAGS